jgi:tRNA A-37 threonylcarbamoyl transferase component Bud32
MTNLVGQTIGQHQIIEPLGGGGMAYVYKAYHPGLDVYRAIKVIRPEFVGEAGFKERFQREAQAVARLRHPNIVQVHDYGSQDQLYYMVMEFIEGEDLKSYLERRGPLRPFGEVISLIEQVASALDYAHQAGILHRDIKPANMMLTPRQQLILTDFGIAKILEKEKQEQMTQAGVGMGTPAYMAPEQARGQLDIGPPADIYSLGIVLYEMLTGRVPYTADTPLAVVLKVVNDPMPSPRTFSPDISDALQGVLLKATAKDPAQRYQTAAALVEGLNRSLKVEEGTVPALSDLSVKERAGATLQPAAPQSQKLLWLIGGILGVAILICLGVSALGGGLYFWTRPISGGGELISLNTPISGQIPAPDGVLSYNFEGEVGQTIFFDEQGIEDETIELTDFILTGPNGQELFNQYGTSVNSADVGPITLEQGGTYTFTIDPREANTPAFSFTFWALEPPVLENGAISWTQQIDGKIKTPGQKATYAVEGKAGQTIFFDEQGIEDESFKLTDFILIGPTEEEVFKQSGTSVNSADSGPITLEQEGSYTLTVDPAEDNIPGFSFFIWLLDPPIIEGGPIEFGQQVQGEIETPGQRASYTIEGKAGQTIFFDEQGIEDESFKLTDFILAGPTGEELFKQSGTSVNSADVGPLILEQDDTYLLSVDPAEDNTPGFSFFIWLIDPPLIEGGSIEFGQRIQGKIQTSGQMATYTLEGEAGQMIVFDEQGIEDESFKLTDFILTGPKGEELFKQSGTSVNSADVEPIMLEQTGTYTLTVDPAEDNIPAFTFVVEVK